MKTYKGWKALIPTVENAIGKPEYSISDPFTYCEIILDVESLPPAVLNRVRKVSPISEIKSFGFSKRNRYGKYADEPNQELGNSIAYNRALKMLINTLIDILSLPVPATLPVEKKETPSNTEVVEVKPEVDVETEAVEDHEGLFVRLAEMANRTLNTNDRKTLGELLNRMQGA